MANIDYQDPIYDEMFPARKHSRVLWFLLALVVGGFIAVALNQPVQPADALAVSSTSTDVGFVPDSATSTPVEPAPATQTSPTPTQPIVLAAPEAPALDAYDQEVLTQMNDARVAAGLPALVENADLDRVASDKLQDLESTGIFSHIGSTGTMSWHWFAAEGYQYKWAGENLAEDYSNADDAFTAYMNSPEHKANILGVHYLEVGMAHQGRYEVVEFGATH